MLACSAADVQGIKAFWEVLMWDRDPRLGASQSEGADAGEGEPRGQGSPGSEDLEPTPYPPPNLRLKSHPILSFSNGPLVAFSFEGREIWGYEGEPVSAALHAAGVRILGHSRRLGRPRGYFCAMGKCSSCRMRVNGVPNVMVCVTPLVRGMRVEWQEDLP